MSAPFKIRKEDLISIAKGALIAAAGAGATYAIAGLGKLDFGLYTPIAVAVLSVAANILRKYLTNS